MTTLKKPRRWNRPVLLAAYAMAVYGLVAAAASPPVAASRCETVRPSSSPSWVLSGGWSGDPQGELVLLDPSRKSLLRFDHDGQRVVAAHRGSVEEALSSVGPIDAWPLSEGGLVVEDAAGVLYRLDPDLSRLTQRRDVADEVGLESIFTYRWGLTDDGLTAGGMVMCGEIERAPDDWSNAGFFYLPLSGEDRRPVVLKSFADDKAPGVLSLGCRVGGQVVAAVHGTAYVLVLSQPPGIYRVNPDPQVEESKRLQKLVLDSVPAALRNRPPLPSLVLRKEYAALMQEVERSTLPVELIGWKDHLFLLMRRPGEIAGTKWSLAKITPGADGKATVELAELNSDARHISIVPGPDRWAFIEKASPRALGDQDVLGFKFVPTESILQLKDGGELCP